MRIVRGLKGNYQVLKKIGVSEDFTVYQCSLEDGRSALLKIASAIEYNSVLDREAFLLDFLRERAESVEKEFVESGLAKDTKLNNHFCFPEMVESFIAADQGNRRVNILGFFDIAEKLSDLVPLTHLRSRDKVLIDARTSVWILGKLLKFFVFTHNQGVAINNLSGGNILINRDHHFVAIFDWTEAEIFPADKISHEISSAEIKQVAEEVIHALGGISEDDYTPREKEQPQVKYELFLARLLSGKHSYAIRAHQEFYKLVDQLWPREFYPFTAHPVTE